MDGLVTINIQAPRRHERALSEHKGLARGVNTRNGRITYDAVAKAVGFDS